MSAPVVTPPRDTDHVRAILAHKADPGAPLGHALLVAMHADQLTVGIKTVRELISNQFPEWTGLPITEVASQGTVNALFRIGDQLAARFPLQPADVDETRRWLESEAEAARELLGRTPFPTPEPVALGDPGAGFPLPWSVQFSTARTSSMCPGSAECGPRFASSPVLLLMS
jgi:hypothetical protein